MSDQAIITLLAEIRSELRALPAAIAAAVEQQGRARRPLSRADQDALAVLLPSIAGAVGSYTFSVHELFQHAELKVQPAIALREALDTVAGRNARKVGRLLRRGLAGDVAGFRVEEVGATREGMLWTVTAITRKTHLGA